MPWMYPESIRKLPRPAARGRPPGLGVHFDPVNLINFSGALFPQCRVHSGVYHPLGPQIRSVHAKDIAVQDQLTVHLDEVRPGLGGLDYRALLTGLDRLGPDLPLMLEHLGEAEEYDQAAVYVRGVAQKVGVKLI